MARDVTLRLETIPPGEELWEEIRDAWEGLLESTGETSAFLTSRWMHTWLQIYGSALRPFGLVWRTEEGVAVGCAVLSVQHARVGPIPIRRSYLNTSAPGQWSCEHNDILAEPWARDSILTGLIERVHQLDVDEWALVGVRERLARELRKRWANGDGNGYFGEAPYVSLDTIRQKGATYLSQLSSNTRHQIKRSIRLYEAAHGDRRLDRAETAPEATEWFEEMLALHSRRWRSVGKPGAFADEATRRFHTKLLHRCVEQPDDDGLVVDVIRARFGERTVGILYNLRYRGRVSFLQCGLSFDDDNRLKPGLVVHTLAAQYYLGTGATEYDFLGGEVEPVRYKRSLSTSVRSLAWLQLPRATPKMRLVEALRTVGRKLRPIVSRTAANPGASP